MSSDPIPSEASERTGASYRGSLSVETVAALTRAIAARPARSLTDLQRRQLQRMIRPRWQADASCASADPVAWYPVKGAIPVPQVGRACAGCPVRRSCLAVALLWKEDGIWAGTNPGHRQHGYRLLRNGTAAPVVVDLLLNAPRPGSAAHAPASFEPLGVESTASAEAA